MAWIKRWICIKTLRTGSFHTMDVFASFYSVDSNFQTAARRTSLGIKENHMNFGKCGLEHTLKTWPKNVWVVSSDSTKADVKATCHYRDLEHRRSHFTRLQCWAGLLTGQRDKAPTSGWFIVIWSSATFSFGGICTTDALYQLTL